jgi:hypothetical protein
VRWTEVALSVAAAVIAVNVLVVVLLAVGRSHGDDD